MCADVSDRWDARAPPSPPQPLAEADDHQEHSDDNADYSGPAAGAKRVVQYHRVRARRYRHRDETLVGGHKVGPLAVDGGRPADLVGVSDDQVARSARVRSE